MRHMLQTFFKDSAPEAVSTLLDITRDKLSEDDIAELSALIKRTEEQGR